MRSTRSCDTRNKAIHQSGDTAEREGDGGKYQRPAQALQKEDEVVEAVLAVEADGRGPFGGGCGQAVREPAALEGRGTAEQVFHDPDAADPAALQRATAGGDAAEDLPLLEQPIGLVLVVDLEFEDHPPICQERLYRLQEPHRQTIGIDTDGQGDEPVPVSLRRSCQQILFQVPHLNKVIEQRNPGLGRSRRIGALQQDLPVEFLELFDPLGHRRLGDAETAGSLLKPLFFQYDGKGLDQSVIQHI